MKLSNDAMAVLVLLFQKALIEGVDISGLMAQLEFEFYKYPDGNGELFVSNPEIVKLDEDFVNKFVEENII